MESSLMKQLPHADLSFYNNHPSIGTTSSELPTELQNTSNHNEISKIDFNIPADLVFAFKARTCQVSSYCDLLPALLACFKILLFRYTGQNDIDISCINKVEAEQMLLRSEVNSNDTFNYLQQKIKENLTHDYTHNSYQSSDKLFFITFDFNNTETLEYTLDDSRTDGIRVHIEYDSSLFKTDVMSRMEGHLIQLMHELITYPIHTSVLQINYITPQERYQLLNEFNSTATYPLDKTVVHLFEEQVIANPNATALVHNDEKMTYRQLDERSNQLAHYLRNMGVKPEMTIAICIERGINMFIGILGILKAGAAYVPVDLNYPADRINYILSDANCSLIVSSVTGLKNINIHAEHKVINLDTDTPIINCFPLTKINHQLKEDNLAYIIYTSGSTGNPKGAMIEHKGLTNFIFNEANRQIFKTGSKVLQFASLSFDASCYEIFNALSNGCSLVIISNEQMLSSALLQQVIRKHQVDIALLAPSYQQIVKNYILDLKTIISGGEALNPIMGRYFQQQGIKVVNAYGPTENTIAITVCNTPIVNEKVLIGKPLINVGACVLDEHQQLVPIGVAGELYVGGNQLARGYWQREQLTAEKFINNPFKEIQGARLYKTGDLVKWMPDGNLEYIGRIDEQIKIRGYRVELGEIESLIEQSGLVEQAVVVCKTEKQGSKRLVAYVIPADNYDKGLLLSFLHSKLPDYMVPHTIIEQQEFKSTPNGKIDRKLLTNLNVQFAKSSAYIGPRNELEVKLVKIWQNVLQVDRIGVHDSFFDLGGTSLSALHIIMDTEELTGQSLTVGCFYNHPTIAGFSRILSSKKSTSKNSLVLMKKGGKKPPFYMVHSADGNVLKFKEFVDLLDDEQPVYGLQNVLSPTDQPLSIEETASRYIGEILTQNPSGPFMLSGYSLGGSIAFEMAKQMQQMGLPVKTVMLFDAQVNKINPEVYPETTRVPYKLVHFTKKMAFNAALLLKSDSYSRIVIRLLKKDIIDYPQQMQKVMGDMITALNNYKVNFYDGSVILFKAKKVLRYRYDRKYLGWKPFVKSLILHDIEGIHRDIFQNGHLQEFANLVQTEINKATA